MKFTKMHGLGNDYVYLDCTESGPGDLPGLARRMSDRHFGVGPMGSSVSAPPSEQISGWKCITQMAPRERCAATEFAVWGNFSMTRG